VVAAPSFEAKHRRQTHRSVPAEPVAAGIEVPGCGAWDSGVTGSGAAPAAPAPAAAAAESEVVASTADSVGRSGGTAEGVVAGGFASGTVNTVLVPRGDPQFGHFVTSSPAEV
jgi:hypothetical protein